jgi:hypothetical protein
VKWTIERERCELDVATDERQNPHVLVCTKNQASYDLRVRQRQKDLAQKARLQQIKKGSDNHRSENLR